MEATMNGPHTTKHGKHVDRLQAILDFAVALTTLMGIAWVGACVLGIAEYTLLGNGLVRAAIDDWADQFNNALRLLAAGVRYMTGGK